MAAKKSEDTKVEAQGDPGPGSALGDGGVSVAQYFQEQDQAEGSRKNPKRKAPPAGESDLISSVEACKLINRGAGYLMYDPPGLYRDAGRSAPSVHEVKPGELRFSRQECQAFIDEWVKRKDERRRLKLEEEAFKAELAEFQATGTE